MQLDAQGSKAFDAYARKHLRGMLATVEQGRVVAVPTINSTSFKGHVVFTTTAADAAKFVAAIEKR